MAKKLKIKVPKRIGGIKVPKQVRKGPVAAFLNSGAGQVLLGEALLFAAGLFTAKRTDPDSRVGSVLHEPVEQLKAGGHSLGDVLSGAQHATKNNSERLHFAFAEAARAFRTALEHGPGEKQASGSGAEPEVMEEGSATAKKKTSRGATPAGSSTPH